MPPSRFPTYRVTCIPEDCTEQELRNGFSDPIVRMSLATSHHHDATKVATITFHNVPEILKGLRSDDYTEINIGAATIRVDSHFLGLTVLYDPGENNAVMDIVAVTGLAGHAYGSWKSRGGCFMWLRDELPIDLATARIMTFGFDSALIKTESDASIPDFSRGLLHGVQNSRISASERQRPLVFLAHSLGGLVVKQAIISAKNAENRPENKDFFNSIYGVLLFGVPNQGIKNEELLTMVKGEPTATLVQDLGEDSTYLDALVNTFFRIFNLEGSEVFSFYETKRTKTVKKNDRGEWARIGHSVRIVSKYSAMGGVPRSKEFHDPIPIPQDHSDMVKFSTADESYCTVKNILLQFTSKCPNIVRTRFLEDLNAVAKHEKNTLPETSVEKKTRVNIDLKFNGIDINARANDGQTALHLAAQNGHSAVVQQLLRFGIDVDAKTAGEITPLHCAALNGHAEIARQLLDAGANVNAKSEMGWTALHLAAERGHGEIVVLLLQNQYPQIKAGMDAKSGQTAIQISC